MNTIAKTPYGFRLTFDGVISADEVAGWVADSKRALVGQPAHFGVFVDMRTLKPLAPDAQEVMKAGQLLYKQAGMDRSVVVISDSIAAMQFRRMARMTGIDAWERYVDAASRPDWEAAAVDWLTRAVDPDRV